MPTRQLVRDAMRSFPLCLAALVLLPDPAGAGFIFFDLGNWQYEAPPDVTITETPGRVNKTFGLTLTTTFTDSKPKVITFRTTPDHNEDERFFMLDINITNADRFNRDWVGFVIKTLDQIELAPNIQDPANIQAHPKWAHIHPSHNSPSAGAAAPVGPNYTNFTILNPDVSYGVEVLTLTGGTVFVGDTWAPDRIRLHDKNALGDMFVSSDTIAFDQIGPMEFKLVLQPLPVPEPSTLTLWSLLLVCGIGAGWSRHRRDRAVRDQFPD